MRKKFVPSMLCALLFALSFSTALLFAICFSVSAHAGTRTYRIGFIGTTPRTAVCDLTPFRSRLRELGYLDRQDFTLEERYWEGKVERLPGILGELIALKPDVIITSGTEAGFAARNATKTIPIVLGFGVDVLRAGFVTELARRVLHT